MEARRGTGAGEAAREGAGAQEREKERERERKREKLECYSGKRLLRALPQSGHAGLFTFLYPVLLPTRLPPDSPPDTTFCYPPILLSEMALCHPAALPG